ncbi:hypothetical protein HDU99_007008 [Rhizoclosmatium hyalinum]|nr:hypothetical protein HDU99_007008 [Rhizoclosmatium hyalinum]
MEQVREDKGTTSEPKSWSINDFQSASVLSVGHTDSVYALWCEGDIMITASRDKTIRMTSRSTGKLIRAFEGQHTGSVLHIDASLADNLLVSGSADNTVVCWDLQTGAVITVINTPKALNVRLVKSIDAEAGWEIVSGGIDGVVNVWDLRSGNPKLSCVGHSRAVNHVAVNEEFIVSAGGDTTLNVWDRRDGQLLRTFVGHTRGIACVELKGNKAFSGSNDATIRVWDIQTGNLIHTMEGHTNLVRTLKIHGNTLVSGSYDTTVRVWDLSSYELKATMRGHSSWVFDVYVDDEKVVSCGQARDEVIEWNRSEFVVASNPPFRQALSRVSTEEFKQFCRLWSIE